MKLTASQLYGIDRAAGFDPADAAIMTAIELAESGGDDQAVGDVGLQNGTWGPSYGAPQIRTLKGDTGRGTIRDIQWLTGDDAHQAAAAFQISQGGADFSPWTEFTNGDYRAYLGQAQAAAAGDTGGTVLVGDKGPAPTWGPDWLPWNWPSNAINTSVNQGLSGARAIVIEGAFLALGLGLVWVGLVSGLAPQIKSATRKAAKAAELGAML